eukprot:scaffold230086_cov34-Tisochrysis_lutea.AAC.3
MNCDKLPRGGWNQRSMTYKKIGGESAPTEVLQYIVLHNLPRAPTRRRACGADLATYAAVPSDSLPNSGDHNVGIVPIRWLFEIQPLENDMRNQLAYEQQVFGMFTEAPVTTVQASLGTTLVWTRRLNVVLHPQGRGLAMRYAHAKYARTRSQQHRDALAPQVLLLWRP